MRLFRRILVTVIVTLGVIFVGVRWIVPVTLSFYASRSAPPITKIVPTDLTDKSIAQTSGEKVTYFGYEFEVPWSDLDQTQTKLYPKDKPDKCVVDLHFHSGLRLFVTAVLPRELIDSLAQEVKMPPQKIESALGSSDYQIIKTIYDFTPDHMHHWRERAAMRDQSLLVLKSIILSNSANTGIFNVQNQTFRGFQEGDPRVQKNNILVHLFSDEGSIEFILIQKDYGNSIGITQPEINRIVQSLRKIKQKVPKNSQIAEN